MAARPKYIENEILHQKSARRWHGKQILGFLRLCKKSYRISLKLKHETPCLQQCGLSQNQNSIISGKEIWETYTSKQINKMIIITIEKVHSSDVFSMPMKLMNMHVTEGKLPEALHHILSIQFCLTFYILLNCCHLCNWQNEGASLPLWDI